MTTRIAPIVNKIELAKMINAYPIFGGTQPDPSTTTTETTTKKDNASGGSTQTEDPIVKLQTDPNALAQLLTQVQTLTSGQQTLQQQLSAVTAERDQFVAARDEAERAQQTKEEQLTNQVNDLKAQVERRDNIIRQKLVENAIATNDKYKWQNARLVQGELDSNALEFNIDIDKGIAEIKGIDAELDRIAGAHSYLVRAETIEQTTETTATTPQNQKRQRTSGNPPRPPVNSNDKEAKRARAMKAFPALAANY